MMCTVSRCSLGVAALLIGGAMLGAATRASAADELAVLPERIGEVRRDEMVYAHLLRLAREALRRRADEFSQLKTPDQVAAYQQARREFFRQKIGEFPERTPLRPQVTGKIDRGEYVVEKVIFESRPQHYVTGHLYVPKRPPPMPGVLVPCGHSENGKLLGAYQAACILLARHGMVVLCFDPIEQGERFQLFQPNGAPRGTPVMNHCLVGLGSTLLGRNAAHFEIWDAMRAVDYLQSRPEVDPQRIGCTGNSGGGTQTAYLMALDDRIRCAAPSCYLTNFEWLLETFGPPDAEQVIHGQVAFGLDHPDYVIVRAPQPTRMLVATRDDCAGILGARENFRQGKRVFMLLGKPDQLSIVEADAPHGFSQTLRVGAVEWMQRWLLARTDPVVEPPDYGALYLKPDEGLCTAEGQVMRLPGARSTYDINAELETTRAAPRQRLWQTGGRARLLDEVRQISAISRLAELAEPEVECAGIITRPGCHIERLTFQPARDLWLPALLFIPDQPDGSACLLVCDHGKDYLAAAHSLIGLRVKGGQTVLAVDLPDLGETRTAGGNKTLRRGYFPMLLGRSMLALRADEILRCARWLSQQKHCPTSGPVHLVAYGYEVGPPALHAAALEPQLFASLTLQRAPLTWTDMVHTKLPDKLYLGNQWYVNLVHGALAHYDLADLIACIPKERLTVLEPVNCWNQPLAPAEPSPVPK